MTYWSGVYIIVFSQQGYFVVAPNPTGSTSFGQGAQYKSRPYPIILIVHILVEFTDRISENWGERPFEDLIKVWKNALKLYPQVRFIIIINMRILLSTFMGRSTPRMLSLLVPVGAVML